MAGNATGIEAPDAVRIEDCKGCFKPMYPSSAWKEMSPERRAKCGGVMRSTAEFCFSCKRYPHLREPEPGADYEDPKCLGGCGAPLVMAAHWRKASYAERDELRDEGYKVADREGYCRGCRARMIRDGSLQPTTAPTRRRGQTLRVWREKHAQGLSDREIARDLGIHYDSLMTTIRRNRKAGRT